MIPTMFPSFGVCNRQCSTDEHLLHLLFSSCCLSLVFKQFNSTLKDHHGLSFPRSVSTLQQELFIQVRSLPGMGAWEGGITPSSANHRIKSCRSQFDAPQVHCIRGLSTVHSSPAHTGNQHCTLTVRPLM